MKYLHDDALAELTALLTDCPVWRNNGSGSDNNNGNYYYSNPNAPSRASNSRKLHGRLEAYTMKRAGTDKKFAVLLGNRYTAEREAAEEDLATAAAANHRYRSSSGGWNSNSSSGAQQGRKRSVSTGEAPSLDTSFKHLKTAGIASATAATTTTSAATGTADSAADTRRGRRRSNSLNLPLQRSVSVSATGIAARTSTDSALEYFRALSREAAAADSAATATVNRRLLTDLILTLNHSFPDYDFCAATAADFTACSLQTAVTRINERLGELAVSQQTDSTYYYCNNNNSNTSKNNNSGSFLTNLWTAVDKVITLSQVAAVYSYQPSTEESGDPFSFLKQTLLAASSADATATVDDSTGGAGTQQRYSSYSSRCYGDDNLGADGDGGGDAVMRMMMDEQQQPAYNYSPEGGGGGEVLWTFNYFFVNKQTKRILLFTCIETMTPFCCYSSATASADEDAAADDDDDGAAANNVDNNNNNNSISGSIPEHEAVHHAYTDSTSSMLLSNNSGSSSGPTPQYHRHRRRASSSQSAQSDEDDDDDDSLSAAASSSAVSVGDFDLDPASSVPGGIPIGSA